MTTYHDANAIDFTGQGPKDHGVMAAHRDFVTLGDRYIFGLGGTGLEFEMSRVRHSTWGEVTGELAVRCKFSGARAFDSEGTIFRGEFSPSKLRSLQEIAQVLARQAQTQAIDFFGLLSELAARVLHADRCGEPAVLLRDVPLERPDFFRVGGFRFPKRHPSVIAGAEGSAKSLVALHVTGRLAAQGVPTLYTDWELGPEDQKARLVALFGEHEPAVAYLRCRGRVADEADRIADTIIKYGSQFLVADSISWAANDLIEAAGAQTYYAVLRRFGIGSLSIAHKAKGDDEAKSIYGSTFWMAGARAIWMVQRSAQTPDDVAELACYPRKFTFGPLGNTIGLRLTFDGDSIQVDEFDPGTATDLAGGVSIIQRVRSVLATGARTREELAAELEGANPASVRRVVDRAVKGGTLIKFPDASGGERIGLRLRGAV